MKLVARTSAWLLPLVLCACGHNIAVTQLQPLAPPIEEAPPPPDLAPTVLPQPVYNIPKTKEPVALQPEPPKPMPKHRKAKPGAPTPPAVNSPGAPTTQVAAAEPPPPEVSAVGQFAAPEAPDSKKQAESSIAEIERGLGGIGRKLSEVEEKTTMQIREFLKQARTALNSGDVDGARTLTAKAKALLGELSQ